MCGRVEDAHVEYFRGIENPIGVKVGTPEMIMPCPALHTPLTRPSTARPIGVEVGPSMSHEELVTLLKKLNPEREACGAYDAMMD